MHRCPRCGRYSGQWCDQCAGWRDVLAAVARWARYRRARAGDRRWRARMRRRVDARIGDLFMADNDKAEARL